MEADVKTVIETEAVRLNAIFRVGCTAFLFFGYPRKRRMDFRDVLTKTLEGQGTFLINQ